MCEKVGKSRNIVFFQWFVAPEGRKVGSLKRRVRSQLARWAMKKCTPLWREAHLQVKKLKSTSRSDHFWKLRCRKSAGRCDTKHISKSKCTKHTMLGPLLEVEMSKKCRPLWREAHFEVKMYKTHHARTTFGSWDVEKVQAVVVRSTCRSQNVQSTPGLDHFWKLRCRKSARRSGAKHISKPKCTKHTRSGPRLDFQMSFLRGRRKGMCTFSKVSKTWRLCHTPLHSTTLHSITLHYSTLHYNCNCNYTILHYTTLRTLHYTTLHYTTSHQLQLQLHKTTLHYTTLITYTILHYTTLHHTTLHYTTLH